MPSEGRPKNWHKLRKVVLERDKGLCQLCLKNGEFEPATCVDHIIPLHVKVDNSISNLQSLCNPCHAAKTAAEKPKIGKGACLHGTPTGMHCNKCGKVVERKFIRRELKRNSIINSASLRNNPHLKQDN